MPSANIKMTAPNTVSVGSVVLMPDGTVSTVGAGGRLQVPPSPLAIAGLMAAGFTFYPDNAVPWVPGRWYAGAETFAAVITVSNKLYATPIYVANRCVISALGVNVTTQQASSAVRMGIYSDNYGKPGDLLFTPTTAETPTTGSGAADGALTEPYELSPGWYWRAIIGFCASTFPSISGTTALMNSHMNQILGATTSALSLAVSAAGAASGTVVDFTYAALPAVYPTTNYGLVVNASCPTFSLKVGA